MKYPECIKCKCNTCEDDYCKTESCSEGCRENKINPVLDDCHGYCTNDELKRSCVLIEENIL